MTDVKGEFVVKVDDAIVMDVTNVEETADSAPALLAQGHDVYEVIYDSNRLYGTEAVHVTAEMIDAFIEIMYMTQRSSKTAEWEMLPEPTAGVYDALIYTQAKIRADQGMESYQQELSEMNEQERYETEEPDNLTVSD